MGAVRDVAGKPIATSDGIPVTTANVSKLTPEQLANTHEILPAAGAATSTELPGLDKVFPAPSASVERPAVEEPVVAPQVPVTNVIPDPVPEVKATAGTVMDYASRYGLLAGGILAVLIIGTVIVKKIVNRKS